MSKRNASTVEAPFGPGDPPVAVTKRSRTAHACDSCRVRKSRCDGARPSCDICTSMGLVCHYRTPARPAVQSVKDDQVARMENRLQAMEAMLKAALGGVEQTNFVQSLAPTQEDNSSAFVGITTPVSVEDIQAAERGTGSTRDADCINAADESVDGMAAISFRGEASGYFGPSSNSALFNLIMAAVTEGNDSDPGPPTKPAGNGVDDNLISRPTSPPRARTGGQRTHLNTDTNPGVLPPDQEIIDYVDKFFSSTGQLFPYLHKPTILKNLASMRMSGFRNVSPSQLCILNLIMALASVFGTHDLPVLERVEKGNVFLSRGLSLLQRDLVKTASLESLQALILLVQYFEGTQGSAQTWKLHGTAVNVGLQLGLQQPRQCRYGGPLEAEIRRRTWWACFMMDRMCSMTFGRPPLIPNEFMCCGLPSDANLEQWEDDDDMLNDAQNTRLPSATAFFAETSKLNLVLGNVINKVYQDNVTDDPNLSCTDLLQETIKMEKSLLEWKNALPSQVGLISLQDIDAASSSHQLHRFRIVLTLRYLNTRALLHRGVVTQFLRVSASVVRLEDAETSLLRTFGLSSLESCSETAINSIGIICLAATNERLLPVWWVSIYYAFNSALLLFAIIVVLHKHQMQLRQTTLQDLLESVATACKTLPIIGGSSRMVLRCQKILNRLMQMASTLEIVPRQSADSYTVEFDQRPNEPLIGQVHDRLAQDFHSQITDAIFFPALDINSTFGFPSFENDWH